MLTLLLAALAAPVEPAAVPIGRYDLLDDPHCIVGYRYDGRPEETLGFRWQGFDPDTGVYFVPEQAAGQNQVFMHCPWRGGTGAAFADFPLRLPAARPIRLIVGVALRRGAKNTDGVTYRVAVDGNLLWQRHCTWRTERLFTIDLSPYAGRAVTLRLEVDPGPKRSSTDDWSLWTEAIVEAGDKAQLRRAAALRRARLLDELKKAARHADRNLAFAAGSQPRDACPTPSGPVRWRLSRTGDVFTLVCRSPSGTIRYRLEPSRGLAEGLAVIADGQPLDPPPFYCQPRPLLGGRELTPRSKAVQWSLASARAVDGRVRLEYRFRLRDGSDRARLWVELTGRGRSLVLDLRGSPGDFAGFSVELRGAKDITPPFCTGSVGRHRSGLYVSAAVELWRSNASALGVGRTRPVYRPLTDGTRRTLRERFYLTVSPRWEEVMPSVSNKPSPFLQELSRRVVLDVWGGKFDDDRRWLLDMARYGIDGFLIIKHVWQRDGYDRSYPNVMPANAALGGDEALRRLSLTAQKLGHRFCLHENFYDYYPNAEAFRAEDCALRPDGSKIPGWFNGAVQAVILKPSKLMDYARRFSTELFRRYRPNAAYHDIMPTWHVDYDATVPDSGMFRATHSYTRQLCDFDRRLFGGPVVFESVDGFMAGVYDGGCNHGVNTDRTPLAPAFELLKVHMKMSNHGFGYYERWLPWGYGPGWYDYVMTDRELDRYRARTVAFGRTGFIGHQLMKHPHAVVREYYLMQAFGRAYTARRLEKLAYLVREGPWTGWVDPATAQRLGRLQRLRAEYEGGQVVYVNYSDSPWPLPPDARGPRGPVVLPPYTAGTFGPRAVAFTGLLDGQVSDFASYGDVIYADARSHQWLPPRTPPPVLPAVAHWKDNGDGTFTMTVRWTAHRRLDRDYTVFWHFRSGGRIRFQYDHKPPLPTTKWPLSKPVADGPATVRVPADAAEEQYDVVVGLYTKEGRATLIGQLTEVKIAVLEVQRTDGRASKIVLRPVSPGSPPGASPEPYLADANTKKRIIDFGPVATNGAVVITRRGETFEVVPVPIGEKMTVGLAGRWRVATATAPDGSRISQIAGRHRDGKTWFDIPQTAAKLVIK